MSIGREPLRIHGGGRSSRSGREPTGRGEQPRLVGADGRMAAGSSPGDDANRDRARAPVRGVRRAAADSFSPSSWRLGRSRSGRASAPARSSGSWPRPSAGRCASRSRALRPKMAGPTAKGENELTGKQISGLPSGPIRAKGPSVTQLPWAELRMLGVHRPQLWKVAPLPDPHELAGNAEGRLDIQGACGRIREARDVRPVEVHAEDLVAPSRVLTNAILLPSGFHTGSSSSAAVAVRRCRPWPPGSYATGETRGSVRWMSVR